MTITISGAQRAPSWETLQRLCREATKDDDAFFVRIHRKDGGVCYTAPGEYELDLRTSGNDIVKVELSVVQGRAAAPVMYVVRHRGLNAFCNLKNNTWCGSIDKATLLARNDAMRVSLGVSEEVAEVVWKPNGGWTLNGRATP